MLNRIVLIGRLTRDPELRSTQTGRAVCTFVLAVDRAFAGADGKREADFINIVVWGKQAETSAQYLSKGKMAAVDGRLQIRSYDGNDGVKRYMTEVVADNVRFLSPREGSALGGGNGAGYSAGYGDDQFNDNMPMTSDDLPF